MIVAERDTRPSLKFCALQYLNDWYRYDIHFVEGLGSSDGAKRLESLQSAAKNYGLSRNFPKRPNEKRREDRLKHAFGVLEKVKRRPSKGNVAEVVLRLAKVVGRGYSNKGEKLISAASKFLWFRYQSPVVIYDKRARQGLKKLSDENVSANSLGRYPDYLEQWRKIFASRRHSIELACADLISVKSFSLACNKPDEEVVKLVDNAWFHERVFDKFLWWYAEVQTLP